MGKRQIVSDSDFGQIVISTRDTAKGISMRPKEDGLYVTAPSCATLKAVMGVVEKYRSRLLDAFSKLLRPRITEGYTIEAECFQLCLKKSPLKHFTMSVEEGGVCIHYPASTDFSSSETQSLLAAAIDGALKKMAMQYLPQRLNFLSKKVGLSFSAVRVSGAHTRWGSCSSKKSISLSFYLMLLPFRLIDYVILHELAHTREMNHGAGFWSLLDRLADGNARLLDAELKKYRPFL